MTTQPLDQTVTARSARPWWIVPTLVVVLAFLAILGYGLMNRDRGQLVDGPAPDVTLQTFEGESIRLSDLKGRPVVLNFWASWCRECDAEMALLENSHRRYGSDVVVLGVAYIDSERASREYLAQYGITYPAGPDLGGRISDAFRIKGVPETFFIDRDGVIQGMHLGVLQPADLDGWLAQLGVN